MFQVFSLSSNWTLLKLFPTSRSTVVVTISPNELIPILWFFNLFSQPYLSTNFYFSARGSRSKCTFLFPHTHFYFVRKKERFPSKKKLSRRSDGRTDGLQDWRDPLTNPRRNNIKPSNRCKTFVVLPHDGFVTSHPSVFNDKERVPIKRCPPRFHR